jgi:hypothetical protein
MLPPRRRLQVSKLAKRRPRQRLARLDRSNLLESKAMPGRRTDIPAGERTVGPSPVTHARQKDAEQRITKHAHTQAPCRRNVSEDTVQPIADELELIRRPPRLSAYRRRLVGGVIEQLALDSEM